MVFEIILILIIVSLSYISYNLFRKNEKYEDTIEVYDNWISIFDISVKDTETKLQQIDEKGTFKSDDEVGFFFDYLQELNKGLSDLFEEQTEEQTEGEKDE